MKIKIQRYCKHRTPDNSIIKEYEISENVNFLLEALAYIKKEQDGSLTYSSGCRSGVCGSCGVRVNGKEELACEYKIKENDLITPLDKMPIIKDLVVEHNFSQDTLSRSRSYFVNPSSILDQKKEDEKMIEKQTDCILCSSCFSSCPVLEVDKEFLGPFALTRAYRYVSDSRNEDTKAIIDVVQKKGVWDCTLCGECTLACPQGIDPKNDILMLRMKSIQAGYDDPTFVSGSDMFGGDFGISF